MKGMSDILEMLHRCATAYKAGEVKRIEKIKREANKRKVEKKPPKEKKKDKVPRQRVPRNFENAKKCVDKSVERAKEYIEGRAKLYSGGSPIPRNERAECITPWCMHFVNGNCVHRECLIRK